MSAPYTANQPVGHYHAGPGTAHEIGVMFGFIAVFVIITFVYYYLWRRGNAQADIAEQERRRALQEKLSRGRRDKQQRRRKEPQRQYGDGPFVDDKDTNGREEFYEDEEEDIAQDKRRPSETKGF